MKIRIIIYIYYILNDISNFPAAPVPAAAPASSNPASVWALSADDMVDEEVDLMDSDELLDDDDLLKPDPASLRGSQAYFML